MRGPRKVLFYELTLAIFVVVALVFAINAWFNILAGRGPLMRLVEENLAFGTRAVFRDVEKHLGRLTQEIELWSRLDTLDDVLVVDRSLRIENLLLGLQRENAYYYASLSVLDRDGRIIASSDVSRIGDALDPDTLAVNAGAVRLDAPHTTPESEEVLVLTQPIVSRLAAEPIGWLVAHARWEVVEVLVDQAMSATHEGRTDRAYVLLNADGHIVAGDLDILDGVPSETLGALAAPEVSAVSLEHRGVYLVARHAGAPGTDSATPPLTAVGLWRRADAHATLRSFVFAVVGSASLGLLLAAGVSFAIARRLNRRIARLIEGTERLAGGDLEHKVEVDRDDELGQLARSFNDMVASLAQSRDEVKRGAARWQAIVQQAPDKILLLDLNGRILFANLGVAGRTADEMIDSHVDSFLPARYRRITQRALQWVARTGRVTGREIEVAMPDGGVSWYATRVGPILQDGRTVAFAVVATDVTERKRLERDTLAVSEEERRRIGRDLHDSLGQTLTGVSLLIRGLEQRLGAESPLYGEVQHVRELVNDAIEEARGLSRGLFPAELAGRGLSGALEELAESVDGLKRTRCRFQDGGGTQELDATKALHLYRIAQEAVTNAIRHGHAQNILIALHGVRGRDELRIEDDGVGLPRTPSTNGGIGLRLMHYRASMIGATLRVQRRRSGGTVVGCLF